MNLDIQNICLFVSIAALYVAAIKLFCDYAKIGLFKGFFRE